MIYAYLIILGGLDELIEFKRNSYPKTKEQKHMSNHFLSIDFQSHANSMHKNIASMLKWVLYKQF